MSIGHGPWDAPGVLADGVVYEADYGRIIKVPQRVCKRLRDLGPAPEEVSSALDTYLATRAAKHDDWRPRARAEKTLDRALIFAHHRATRLPGPEAAPVQTTICDYL